MKKKITFLILFCAGISLSAQNKSDKHYSKKSLEKHLRASEKSNISPVLKSIALGERAQYKQEDYIISNGNILITAFSNTTINDLAKTIETTLSSTDIKIRGNNQLSAWLSISDLTKLSTISSLKYAFPEMSPTSRGSSKPQSISEKLNTAGFFNGSVTGQGDAAIQADILRNTYNVDGTGLKIGIMSDSYDVSANPNDGSAAASIIAGDLPGANNPNGFTQDVVIVKEFGGNLNNVKDEGRAMAEIIHDIAPGAEIFYRTAFEGQLDFVDGINELVNLGCDIIVDDIGYFAEPNFQDGLLVQAIDQYTANGGLYFTAAGNQGSAAFTSLYLDSGVNIPNTLFGRIHDFGAAGVDFESGDLLGNGQTFMISGLEIDGAPGSTARLTVQWDDPSILANPNGPFPDTDITITVWIPFSNGFFPLGSTVDNTSSITTGIPSQTTTFTFDANPNVPHFVVISTQEGVDPGRFLIINNTFNVSFLGNENSGTIIGHANATGALTAGAVRYDNTPAFGGTPARQVDSSVGGVPVFLDINGNTTPFNFRNKPDFMAPTGANTTFFLGNDFEMDGNPNFFGTSASAPHAAAAAALMLETAQSQGFTINKNQFLNAVIATSVDIGTAGYDIFNGNGLMLADQAMQNLVNTLSIEDIESQNSNIKIFPNPLVEDLVTFSGFKQNDNIDINIYNMLGQEIYSFSESITGLSLSVNLPDIKPGTYLVVTNTNQIKTTHKLIVK